MEVHTVGKMDSFSSLFIFNAGVFDTWCCCFHVYLPPSCVKLESYLWCFYFRNTSLTCESVVYWKQTNSHHGSHMIKTFNELVHFFSKCVLSANVFLFPDVSRRIRHSLWLCFSSCYQRNPVLFCLLHFCSCKHTWYSGCVHGDGINPPEFLLMLFYCTGGVWERVVLSL